MATSASSTLSRKGVDWFISLVPEIGYTLLPFGAAPENAFPIYGGQFALIKQVASARFGVTSNYLVNADELQTLFGGQRSFDWAIKEENGAIGPFPAFPVTWDPAAVPMAAPADVVFGLGSRPVPDAVRIIS